MGLLDFLLGGDDSSFSGGRDWDRSVFDSDSNKEKHRKLLTFNYLWLLFQGTFPTCTDIP